MQDRDRITLPEDWRLVGWYREEDTFDHWKACPWPPSQFGPDVYQRLLFVRYLLDRGFYGHYGSPARDNSHYISIGRQNEDSHP